jgi:hypothetical protein
MTNTIYSSPLSLPLTFSIYSIHTSKDLSKPVLSNSRFRIAYNLFSAVGGRDLLTTHLHFPSAFKGHTSLPIRHVSSLFGGERGGGGSHTKALSSRVLVRCSASTLLQAIPKSQNDGRYCRTQKATLIYSILYHAFRSMRVSKPGTRSRI